jgi:prepilin-type N-terminal cleavage/methylation domain-containing protein
MQRGFSFIELVVVLAVLAILTAVAVPRTGDSITARELEDAALQLASDIRWIQQEAVNRTADMASPVITFYSTGYSIEAGLGNRLKPFTRFPASVQLVGTTDPISFKLDGKPVVGATIALQRKSKPALFRYVIVLQTTGRIRVVNSL